MNFEDLHSLIEKKLYVDLVLVLKDECDEIIIDLHKNILYSSCIFFKKLLTSCKEKTSNKIIVYVPNVYAAYDTIMLFYKHKSNKGNFPKWKRNLETIKCHDYFGLNFDASLLLNDLKIPYEGFDLLLEVINIILPVQKDGSINVDENLLCSIYTNLSHVVDLPCTDINSPLQKKYDLSRLSNELLNRMIEIEKTYRLIFSDGSKILITNIYTDSIITILWGHSDEITTICFSYNSLYIASASYDRSIKIWNAKTGYLITSINNIYQASQINIYQASQICFSPDNLCVVSLDRNDGINFWNIHTGLLIRSFKIKHKVETINYSFDGLRIYLTYENNIYILDSDTGYLVYQFSLVNPTDAWCFLLSRQLIIFISRNKSINICDINTGAVTDKYFIEDSSMHAYQIICSPNNLQIALLHYNNNITIWNIKPDLLEYVCGLKLSRHIENAFYSPDSSQIITYSKSRVQIWDAANGLNIRSFYTSNINNPRKFCYPLFRNDVLETFCQHNDN